MKTTRLHQPFSSGLTLLPILLILTAIGCATFKSTNWNERVGTYHIDDAKAELGNPDQTEDLADGGFLAQWIQRSSHQITSTLSTGNTHSPRTSDPTGLSLTTQPRWNSEIVLTLTFNDEGMLTSWKRSTR
ncbi:MAG: hypothetical protein M2R45_05372 [Verrucomicrobia subdivision 3 bacterium]|nr:hypothetical protein [Limisphaerales bacterium]MCS1417847.1 hypothetical protein [Limisphaerales bacterium]